MRDKLARRTGTGSVCVGGCDFNLSVLLRALLLGPEAGDVSEPRQSCHSQAIFPLSERPGVQNHRPGLGF